MRLTRRPRPRLCSRGHCRKAETKCPKPQTAARCLGSEQEVWNRDHPVSQDWGEEPTSSGLWEGHAGKGPTPGHPEDLLYVQGTHENWQPTPVPQRRSAL